MLDQVVQANDLPKAPGLHWVWVLLACILGSSLFAGAWLYVQARWLRKVHNGNAKSEAWCIAFIATMIAGMIVLPLVLSLVLPMNAYVALLCFAIPVTYFVTIYLMQGELARSPVRISTWNFGAFVLGPIYFQYLMQRREVEQGRGLLG